MAHSTSPTSGSIVHLEGHPRCSTGTDISPGYTLRGFKALKDVSGYSTSSRQLTSGKTNRGMESTLIPDWSELNSDILEYLSSFLSLSDYSRFGAVCRNWFSVAKQKRHPPRQLPWLVMGEDDATHKRKFYSIDEKKHYLIDIPELRGQRLCGSSYGWLFTLDIELNFRLLNPFTKNATTCLLFLPMIDIST
ncbi:F-box protein [Carex littledalei]|uniref:F-box protein n=1 Tax=Carex littledalei TaxID=544730 RepID=A0A833R2D1_9POAL|nr:F-box protein [Carex littledalei]